MTWAMRLNGGQLMKDGEPVKHEDGFTVGVLKRGTVFGNGEPLSKTLNTLMTQGSWEVFDRFGNRAPALIVKIEGETPDGLNAGEVWLSKLMGPGALEWLPPDQTVTTVFDVVSSYIDLAEDDDWSTDETKWVRKYRIPIKALPHARSRNLTVTPAQPTAATPLISAVVNDGSSVTGWAGGWTGLAPYYGGGNLTPTIDDGRVRISGSTLDSQNIQYLLGLTYTIGSAVPDETPYMRVDMSLTGPAYLHDAIAVTTAGTSSSLQPLLVTPETGEGFVAYFRLPSGTRAFTVRARAANPDEFATGGSGTAVLAINQLTRVSRLEDNGTNRQKVAALYPGGSAPAEGSLHVSHPTDGLGKVLLHTYPLGRPSPALTQWQYAGATAIPDATQINGQRIPIHDLYVTLRVPDAQLPVHGRAALWVKLRVDGAPAQVSYTVTPRVGGLGVGASQPGTVTVPTGSSLLVPLGLVDLPGTVTGPAGATDISIMVIEQDDVIEGAGVWVDEVWAFGQDDDSALTVVDAVSGTPVAGGASNHLWINAPSADKPAGEVLIGTTLADARWPSVIQAGPQVHKLGRDGAAVLTVTCGGTDASTNLTHYKRWTHHAAENE